MSYRTAFIARCGLAISCGIAAVLSPTPTTLQAIAVMATLGLVILEGNH